MRKQLVILFVGLFLLTGSLVLGDDFKDGNSAVFLGDGHKVIGKVIDFSSTRNRLKIQKKSGEEKEVKLSDIWMINFINTEWNFPEEINQIKTPRHYLFLKTGDIVVGKIVRFDRDLSFFEFYSGSKIRISSLRRIYFSKNVPSAIKTQSDKLEGNNCIVFLHSSKKILGEVINISAKRHVLEIRINSGLKREIKLSEIWMINFVNTGKDFPEERNQIETPQNYLFLKNGDIVVGKIVRFDRDLDSFELNSGSKVTVDSLKRIYFRKDIFRPIRPPLTEKIKKTEIKK